MGRSYFAAPAMTVAWEAAPPRATNSFCSLPSGTSLRDVFPISQTWVRYPVKVPA